MLALAVQLRAQGVDVRMCAPPDFAEHVARIDVPMIAAGKSVRDLVHGVKASGTKPSTPADAPRVAAVLVATQFETVAPAAEGCDALVATGLMPAGLRVDSRVARHPLRVRGVHAGCAAVAAPDTAVAAGPAVPAGRRPTRSCGKWMPNGCRRSTAPRSTRTGRRWGYLRWTTFATTSTPTGRGWRPTRPSRPWPGSSDLDVVQTGAWILPDTRPLPAELTAFLDAGTPPIYVGFSSVRAPEDVATVAIEAIRAQGRRVLISRGWADLARIDDQDDCFIVGEVNLQALFTRVAAVVHHGGAGTTTTAARAGAPQVVVPQIADQPYWAGRVAALGIGVAHDGANPTTESLSAALESALTPAVDARAVELAGMIRTDGAAVAAKLLIDAVSSA